MRNLVRPAGADASWTKKHSARDPSQREWVFGDKAYVVADANHDVARGIVVTTTKRNDSPFLPSPLAELASGHSWFSLAAGAVVIADRGYDSRSNNVLLHRNGGVPVIHQCGLPPGKLHNGIYTAEGAPTCLGGRWRMSALIPIPGVICTAARKAAAPGVIQRAGSVCDDESWENPEGNIKLFGRGIRRGSAEWKEKGRLERHCYFGLRRVSARAGWQMLMSLAAQLDQVLAEKATRRGTG